MNAYRKRFIRLNLLMIGTILTVIMLGVGAYVGRSYYDGLHDTMKQVVEPLREFGDRKEPPDKKKLPEGDFDPARKIKRVEVNAERRKDIMTVLYQTETAEYSVQSQTGLLDESALPGILEAVMEAEDFYGLLRGYGVIYYKTGRGDLCRVALASASYVGKPILELAGILLAVWLAAMFGFYWIARVLSAFAVKPLEEAQKREREFVADASHDLKTPLAVILANQSIIRESPQKTVESQQKWLDGIADAARQMQGLVEEMLTLSETERPVALPLTPVDFSSIADGAALQMEAVAFEKGIALETEIAEGVVLHSNQNYLQRIVTSLIDNAIKYEPAGGSVTVTLAAAKKQAVLTVQNKSSVIAEEDLPHVFERFYRADKSRTGQGGHGLGLSIVRQMVERLGGTIQVSSGEGTTFLVSLPTASPSGRKRLGC